MRINISLPSDLLREMDAYCKRIHDTRSGFISDLIREKIFSQDIIRKTNLPIEKIEK